MYKKCVSFSYTRSAKIFSLFICCSFDIFVTKSVPMIVAVYYLLQNEFTWKVATKFTKPEIVTEHCKLLVFD